MRVHVLNAAAAEQEPRYYDANNAPRTRANKCVRVGSAIGLGFYEAHKMMVSPRIEHNKVISHRYDLNEYMGAFGKQTYHICDAKTLPLSSLPRLSGMRKTMAQCFCIRCVVASLCLQCGNNFVLEDASCVNVLEKNPCHVQCCTCVSAYIILIVCSQQNKRDTIRNVFGVLAPFVNNN